MNKYKIKAGPENWREKERKKLFFLLKFPVTELLRTASIKDGLVDYRKTSYNILKLV